MFQGQENNNKKKKKTGQTGKKKTPKGKRNVQNHSVQRRPTTGYASQVSRWLHVFASFAPVAEGSGATEKPSTAAQKSSSVVAGFSGAALSKSHSAAADGTAERPIAEHASANSDG